MLNDIQYALRTLRQNPGFALTAILSIALGIGANSTIFSYADGLLLRPLPVPNPSEVVTLRSVPPSLSSLPVLPGTGQSRMSYRDFEEFRSSNRSFKGLVAYGELFAAFLRDTNAQAEFELGYQVSGDFFRVLGVEPRLGRGFRAGEDETPGKDPVVVLSHDLWKNEFAADPAVIGRRVGLNNVTLTVIGVAPESFTGMDQFLRPDFFVPIAMGSTLDSSLDGQRTQRDRRAFVVKGRLKPGISIRAAAEESLAFARSLERFYPATNRGFGATVITEREMRLISWPALGGLVGALFTVSVVILLIACANVGNLMLGRGYARAREIAVRLAVGASRRRLVRLLLIESMLIAAVSGALALLAAQFTVGIFSAVEIPADQPIHVSFQVDERVLWFTAAASAATALLFGLVPALQSTRLDLVSVMKAGESDHSRKRFFGRSALVVVQIAGSMILLVLTTQARSNFNDVLNANPGFRRDHRITMRLNPEASGSSPEQTQRFYETVVEKGAELTGIKSAAVTSGLPMTYDRGDTKVIPEGYEFPPDRESTQVFTYIVDHHYFETFGVPVLAGRGFRAMDRADAPRVVVVNEAFAKQYLGSEPIGKRLRLNGRNGPLAEVVGVTMTGKTLSLIEPPIQVIYLPLSQNPRTRMTLIAETAGDPAALAGPLEAMVRSVDPNITIFRVRTMDDIFERSSVNTIRTVARIYDFAAVLGLLLAVVGLYAVVSYQVARRTREIGIRMALGAKRLEVVRIFVGQAMTMSLSGVSTGLVLSVFANRASETTLGLAALSPVLLGMVSLALLLTTLAASAIPARNAARIDPQKALRQD